LRQTNNLYSAGWRHMKWGGGYLVYTHGQNPEKADKEKYE
ncbi:MAG: hypothetical protein ACI9O5_003262, partial [Algoriphagus sp.]